MAKYGDYDWAKDLCGVYMLKCKHNGKRYIGSSVNIKNRITTHFGRDCKRYPNKPLYFDINKYGFEGFELEVLIECDRNDLIGYEKLCYLELKPEYNLVIPMKCNFDNPEVRKKSLEAMKTDEFRKQHLESHQTKEYIEKMSNLKEHLKIPVIAINFEGEIVKEFNGMGEAQRWLNETTSYTSKNKVAKIRECCLGTRKIAFGYKWEFKNKHLKNEK